MVRYYCPEAVCLGNDEKERYRFIYRAHNVVSRSVCLDVGLKDGDQLEGG